MSVEIVKQQVTKFLSSETPEVLAIKGDWGVGKTFTWNKYISDLKSDISMNRYSYVSLFGLNSLKDLKLAIFENTIHKNVIGQNATLDTFRENTYGVIEKIGRKSSFFINKNSFTKGIAPIFESVSFMSLNRTIVCLDDMERKGDALSVKEILGLVSLIKEQKQCKVVLLLNDNEKCIEDYKKYREKVVDIELHFNPTAEECANAVFAGSDWQTTFIKEHVVRLGVRNIRVLYKIKKLMASIPPKIESCEDEVKLQIVHSLVLFSWCFYCSKDGGAVPSLDYVFGYRKYYMGLDSKPKTNIEKGWDEMLSEYGFVLADELDVTIKEAVISGYFNVDDFLPLMENINKKAISSRSEGSFRKAWELFHYDLNSSQDDVTSALYKSLKDNAEYVSPMNLDSTVSLFRSLDENKKASDMIDLYIEKRAGNPDVFNLDPRRNHFSSEIKDPEVREKFGLAWEAKFEPEDPKDVIFRLGKINGLNDGDAVCLRKLSSDDFYRYIKNIKGEVLPSAIEGVRRVGSYDLQHDQSSKISENFEAALKMIAMESEINRLRMKRYGVEIDC